MKILAFYNIKGGVGKTASCVNLAYLAAADGFPTLLCDLDPQGSSSYYFRIRPPAKYTSKKFLKGGKRITKSIRGTDFDCLDLLPSHLSYRHLDILLDHINDATDYLKTLFAPLEDEYTYLFWDCPPNITLFSESIFTAADFIFVPVIPTVLSAVTFDKLADFFRTHDFPIEKIFPFFSMVEKRKSIHQKIINEFQAENSRVLQNRIPYSAEIEKMGIYRQPLLHYNPSSAEADTYRRLWREMKSCMQLATE